jgi:hypothetical protein
MSMRIQFAQSPRCCTWSMVALLGTWIPLVASAQSTHLLCKPIKPSLIHEALCTGDARYCGRLLEVDATNQQIREVLPTPESKPVKWSETIWSEGFIELHYPAQTQKWPNGRVAYVVKGKETLNRFTRELTTSYTTSDANDRYLPREEAMQIGRALGADLVVAPSYGTTQYSCEPVKRRL